MSYALASPRGDGGTSIRPLHTIKLVLNGVYDFKKSCILNQ